MRQAGSSFLRNSFSAYLFSLLDFFLKLVVFRLIFVHLGSELLGTWAVIKACIFFPVFMQQGITFAIMVRTSREPDHPKLAETLMITAVFHFAIAVVIFAFAGWLSIFFRIPADQYKLAIQAFRLSAITFFISSFVQVFLAFLQGIGRFDRANLIIAVFALLNSAADLILLWNGFQILALLAVDLCTNILLIPTVWIVLQKTDGSIKFETTGSIRNAFSLVKEAAGQILFATGGKILWELDGLMIPRFFGLEGMSPYWLARRIPYAWGDMMWTGAWPAIPETATISEDSEKRLRRIHWLQTSLVVSLAVTLWYFADSIVFFWLGKSDILIALWMRILIVAVAIDFFPAAFVSFLFARGKVFAVSGLVFASAAAKIIVSLVALQQHNLKLLLIGTALGACTFACSIMFLAAREIKEKSILVKPLLPGIAGALVTLLLLQLVSANSVLTLLVFFSLALFVQWLLILAMLRWIFPGDYDDLIRTGIATSDIFHATYAFLYGMKRRFALRLQRTKEAREERFENLYRKDADPWSFSSSEYELKRYSDTAEFLDGRKFQKGLELGCSEGLFTAQIASRCDTLIGCDISQTALDRARDRCREFNHVNFLKVDLIMDSLPDQVDLVCCAETLNCLVSVKHLKIARDKIINSLSKGGWLLIANLNLLPDDRKGVWLKDLGFGSSYIHLLFAKDERLEILRELDRPSYRITLFARTR